MAAPAATAICEACSGGNHGYHARGGFCAGAVRTTIPTSGSSIVKTSSCGCTERPDPPQEPHNVMHTNTSPLYFPREIVAHILELAQEGGQGSVELHFDAGLLKAWKLTNAGRSSAGFDTRTAPVVS